jgi:hypothetical protein
MGCNPPVNKLPNVLIDEQFDSSVATKRFRIRASLMRLFHDAAGLAMFDSRHERVQFHGKTEAALIIFDQTDERPDR